MSWFGWGRGPTSGESGARRAEPRLLALGTLVICHHYEVGVASVEPFHYLGPNPPPEGTQLWAALVEMANLHHEPVHYAPHKWQLYDRQHYVHSTVVSHFCRQPGLANTYLAPGGRVRGHVTFQIPRESVPARISFVADNRGVADFAVPEPPETG